MSQIHAENGVTRLDRGKIDRHVGLGPGMGLDIDVFGSKEGFGPGYGEFFNDVDGLATGIVASSGIAFGILVGHDRSHRFENGGADVVFGGDQDQAFLFTADLACDCLISFGIFLFEPEHGVRFLSQ